MLKTDIKKPRKSKFKINSKNKNKLPVYKKWVYEEESEYDNRNNLLANEPLDDLGGELDDNTVNDEPAYEESRKESPILTYYFKSLRDTEQISSKEMAKRTLDLFWEIKKIEDDETMDSGLKEKNIKEKKEKIVKLNLFFAAFVARLYKYKCRHLKNADLVQAASIGLLIAVEKFKVEKGFHFLTYATWWIKQYIIRTIANLEYTIRLPVYVKENRIKISGILAEHQALSGRKLDDREIIEKLGILDSRWQIIKNAPKEPFSIEVPVKNLALKGYSVEAEEILASDEEGMEDTLNRAKKREIIEKFLSTLKPNEEKVVKMRFGILEGEEYGREHTLQEIGDVLNLSRERIRQIESEALKKIGKYFLKNSISF